MNKFKVGDKVKLVSIKNEDTYYRKYLGKVFTIKTLSIVAANFEEETEENIAPYLYNLQKIEENYTYKDLKKAPIGTKVTFENGNIFLKFNKEKFINLSAIRSIEWLSNLNDNFGQLGKIIKIEEPTYTTVYETKPEILDEAEKRYLGNVIKPFRNKVNYIRKISSFYDDKEFLQIDLKSDAINFPCFAKNAMYKRLIPNKKYTLEELGL